MKLHQEPKRNNLLDVAEVIGWDKAVALAKGLKPFKRRGKTERILYVPRTASSDHHIAQLIGLESMKAICQAMPCCAMTLGHPDRLERRHAVETLLRDTAMPFSEIARRTGYALGSVYRRAAG